MLFHVFLQNQIVNRYFITPNEHLNKSDKFKNNVIISQEYLLHSFSEEIQKELYSYFKLKNNDDSIPNNEKATLTCCKFLEILYQNHSHYFGITFGLAKDLERAGLKEEAIAIYKTINKDHPDFDDSCYEIAHLKYISLIENSNEKLLSKEDQSSDSKLKEEDQSLDSESKEEDQCLDQTEAKIKRDLDISNDILLLFFEMGTISHKASELLKIICFKRVCIEPLERHTADNQTQKFYTEIERLVSKAVSKKFESGSEKSENKNPESETDLFKKELEKIAYVRLNLLAYRNTTTLNSDSHTDNSDNLISGNNMMDNQASRS